MLPAILARNAQRHFDQNDGPQTLEAPMPTKTIAPYEGGLLPADLTADNNPHAFVEVSDEGTHLTVVWIEPLGFHLIGAPAAMAALMEPAPAESKPLHFSPTARDALAAYVAERLMLNYPDAPTVQTEAGEEWEDSPSVAISFRVATPAGLDTTLDAAVNLIWAFLAEMTNITDPGTFGHPYVMKALADRLASAGSRA